MLYRLIVVCCCLALPGWTADKPKKSVLKTKYGDLQIFPVDNAWNRDISRHKVHPNSANFIKSIGADKPLHPDFGTTWKGAPNGIPFVVVPRDQKRVKVTFRYADESDKGPYPIPPDAPIEGGPDSKGDRHVIAVDFHRKKLYELFAAYPQKDGSWKAGSGAIFDLTSNKLRPRGWTSADAAGLPVFAGLVRYDEVMEQKEIRHALRFTVRRSQRGYIPPATHFASRHRDRNLPPMGLRLRLKADYDLSQAPPAAKVILTALKTYGMIVADNGGDWFISGAPHPKWDVDDLRWIKRVKGRDFDVVHTGKIITR